MSFEACKKGLQSESHQPSGRQVVKGVSFFPFGEGPIGPRTALGRPRGPNKPEDGPQDGP
eukprot:6014648-Pyramimonas_sp.AAC.2